MASDGAFCDSCGVCADSPQCIKKANKKLPCKVITTNATSHKHHWVKGGAKLVCCVKTMLFFNHEFVYYYFWGGLTYIHHFSLFFWIYISVFLWIFIWYFFFCILKFVNLLFLRGILWIYCCIYGRCITRQILFWYHIFACSFCTF